MAAKKFILQICTRKILIVLSRKMTEMMIVMVAIRTVLHGETGGRDLCITRALSPYTHIIIQKSRPAKIMSIVIPVMVTSEDSTDI
ncbi:hypothetical protein AG4045_003866 [Apium graveolens]|uniref:Uncharacterized protein n=1 Tax=Apium graveolens TaxID=4045 RepID=A0A6L5BBY7_APIGR|nr:hypothetical protein AG4045_003866 [Apium graveolens]